MQQGYIKGFDGLRAVAILWVMFGHISSTLNWSAENSVHKAFLLLTNMGWVGVQLFFVLSGFLITQILLRSRSHKHYFKNFYIRRSLRIFPIYYFALFIFFIIIPIFFVQPTWFANASENQIWYWLYLQNWIRPFSEQGALAPLWSLAIEEQYYLIWPMLVLFLNEKKLKLVCLFMIVSAPIFRFSLYQVMPMWFSDIDNIAKSSAYNFTFARWDAIAIGSFIGIYFYQENTIALKKWATKLLLLLSAVVLVQIAFMSNFTSVSEGIGIFNQTTAALIFGCIIVIIASSQEKNWHINILELKVLKSIGKVSYSMYIFHLPLSILWINYWSPVIDSYSSITKILIVLAHYFTLVLLVYLLAKISWKFFESPILKYKQRFN